MYFIKAVSCCVSVFFFSREIDFLGSECMTAHADAEIQSVL